MVFVINSVLLGVGLAMDAFSVSIVNGLNETRMSKEKTFGIAGTYAGFQFAMPMIGWFCVHTIAEAFQAFQKYIPWIALLLLLYIGGKMLLEGIRNQREAGSGDSAHSEERCDEKAAAPENSAELGLTTLLLQGVATSIDALSVGFTISGYNAAKAFIASLLIAVTTLVVCLVGLRFGKKFGDKLADKATVLGGVILILIGIEIFVTGI